MKDNPNKFILLRLEYHNQTNKTNKLNINAIIFRLPSSYIILSIGGFDGSRNIRAFIFSNQIPFVTKDLSKTIMKRSKLRNNYLKIKTDASCKNKTK